MPPLSRVRHGRRRARFPLKGGNSAARPRYSWRTQSRARRGPTRTAGIRLNRSPFRCGSLPRRAVEPVGTKVFASARRLAEFRTGGSASRGRRCPWMDKAGTCPAPPLATASAWEAGALLHLRSWSWSGRGRRSSAGLAASGTTQVVGERAHERAQDRAPARRGVGEPRPVKAAGALRMLVAVGSPRGAAGSC
jgi:hypothetical protein